DVNERTALYVNAYQELRDLTDIFRAYVASVKLVQKTQQICSTVRFLPLTDGERISAPLPEFHPSELFITVAQYSWSDRRERFRELMRGGSNNGGIALRGKVFSAIAAVEQETSIIREVRQELAAGIRAPSWTGKSGREYLAFNMDAREPPRKVPIVSADRG